MGKFPPSLTPWLVAALLAAGAASSRADVLTLKNGEKLEGEITAETPTQVTIEYHVSASITDSRTVPKSDLQKIEKGSADEKLYQDLKSPVYLQDLSYDPSPDAVIGRLQAFLAKFPQSLHVAEVQQMLDAKQAERKRVADGDVKIGERWFSKEAAVKERVEIAGQNLFEQMQKLARRGDLPGALNCFDQLVKTAGGSRFYPDAVDLAKRILPALESTAKQDLQTWSYRKAERARGLQLASQNERTEMLAAVDRQNRQEEATLQATAKAGLAWPPLLTDNEKALTDLSSKAVEAEKALAAAPVDKMRQSISFSDDARGLMEHGNLSGAKIAVTQATTLWSGNELAVRLGAELGLEKH